MQCDAAGRAFGLLLLLAQRQEVVLELAQHKHAQHLVVAAGGLPAVNPCTPPTSHTMSRPHGENLMVQMAACGRHARRGSQTRTEWMLASD